MLKFYLTFFNFVINYEKLGLSIINLKMIVYIVQEFVEVNSNQKSYGDNLLKNFK